MGDDAISFGPFHLLAGQHRVLEGDRPVRLGSRALEILIALVERPGELVTRDELFARAWPGLSVDETNLRTQIAILRRALGEGRDGAHYVATVSGRGYRFVAAVTRSPVDGSAPVAAGRRYELPVRLTRPIGRAESIDAISSRLQRCRCVTVVGPGGIGKTTVALAAAERLSASYADGILFLDLSLLADPSRLPSALAAALGIANVIVDPMPGLLGFLSNRRMLILLDNCEHLVGSAAMLVETVLKSAPGIDILATSREPLRAEAERVHRLAPLETPPTTTTLTAVEALSYAAVQLFVERATASLDTFELTDMEAPLVAELCRRLDGIALAIELAAARTEAFGVSGLTALLHDRFHLLTAGRRTALARHQTLRATLDWSFESLTLPERIVLRRLAVVVGSFAFEAATAIAADSEIAADEVADLVASLVAKSLIVADSASNQRLFRLLDTTRAYALEKLIESGELEACARRHTIYFTEVFEQARTDWPLLSSGELLARYGRQIDNMRTALDWCCSDGGSASVGLALSVTAIPLLFDLGFMEECCRRAGQALAMLERLSVRGDRAEMQLRSVQAAAQVYVSGITPDIIAEWSDVLRLADELDDAEHRARALWGMWNALLYGGSPTAALTYAQRFAAHAADRADLAKTLLGDRIIGISLHHRGDQRSARAHLEQLLAHYVAGVHGWYTLGLGIDQVAVTKATLARVLWLQGDFEQAAAVMGSAVEATRATGHSLSACYVLVEAAVPLSLLNGDTAAAETFLNTLSGRSAHHGLVIWQVWSRCADAALQIARGDDAAGRARLYAAVEELRRTGYLAHLTFYLATVAESLARSGHGGDGLLAIDQALDWANQHDQHWCTPDLLRIKAELLLQSDEPNAAVAAEEYFIKALELARAQEALAWELRVANGLARLRCGRGEVQAARGLLTAVRARFGPAPTTRDLRTADKLLSELA